MPIREVNVNRQSISIKGRVIQKSRTLQTLRGGLRFFHVDIIDKDNDVIRIKFWRNKAEEYYHILDQGSVYIFKCTGSDVMVSNSKFNDTANPYEINFSDRCVLIKIEDDDDSISKAPKYAFTTIRDVKDISTPSIVDIIGVVKQFTPCVKVISKKNNDEVSRRTINLVDDTEHQINITLWGELADMGDEKLSGNPVIALKSIQIRDYQGKQGSTLSGRSLIDFSPNDNRFIQLKDWFNEHGSNVKFQSISIYNSNESTNNIGKNNTVNFWKTLSEIKSIIESNEVNFNQTYNVLARISKIGSNNMVHQNSNEKSSLTYDACPKCKKKVLNTTMYCEKCDESVLPETKYLFPVTIEDHTCSLIVRCFHETASTILSGLDASAYKYMASDNDKKLNFILNFQYLWKYYNLRITLKNEEYNNQKRIQATIQSAELVDFEFVAKKMTGSIQMFISNTNKRFSRNDVTDTLITKKSLIDWN
ncbi:replication protein A large subunit [Cryptosporidium ryanae]|uniref:replication protein A large subunit n=1 Tax=Cryptosporidium ryanae TaxID=515981 RepID=UPI00351A0273|nr:replication protein A large subunit [Cryptosporidium ryanae]